MGIVTISSFAFEEQFLEEQYIGLDLTRSVAVGFQGMYTQNSEVLDRLHMIFHLIVEL